MGAVFQQLVPGAWAPLAFHSKKLSSAESLYATFDREFLAAYFPVRYFRFLIKGRDFTLFTDHKPLMHLPGSQIIVADALSWPSRLPFPALPLPFTVSAVQPLPEVLPLDFSEISPLKQSCSKTSSLLSNSSLCVVSVPSRGSSALCHLSTGFPRPSLVPVLLSCRVLKTLHNLSHPGVCSLRRLVSWSFVLASLSRDVSAWARACLQCQRS